METGTTMWTRARSDAITTLGERLVEFAALMNTHGIDSEEANIYLKQHQTDQEFTELAELSRRLKRELLSQSEGAAMRIGPPADETG